MFDPVLFAALMGSTALFSPSSLFSAGEQGAWYDPSDFSTMFQDSAGTTPVTAVEQPVGLIRDKSGRNNHASQSTSASRPVLSARVNLLTYSEQFDNAAWVKSTGVTVSANTDVAPDGTTTADTMNSSAGNQIDQSISCSTSTVYTDSIYFKKTSGAAYQPALYLLFSGGTLVIYAVRLNTDTGVATAVSAGGFTAPSSFAVQEFGGYWRLSITGNSNNNTTATLRLYPNLTAGGGVGGAGSQIIWGADLRVTNDGVGIPAYQRVAAATDYDTSGFPLYLRFDGTDDSLATASIDFSATDKMSVFAGVRKLSDAATGLLIELGDGWATQNGSFGVYAPSYRTGGLPANKYYLGLKGSTGVREEEYATYTAPLTNVLNVNFNIGAAAASEVSTRINGAVVSAASAGGDAGGGNFGNYIMRIGRYAGSSSPLNGRIYSLIVRGAQSTDAQIASTEAWVDGKTGAY